MLRLFPPPAEDSPLWDLPLPQLRTLHVLRRRGDMTMREVAGSLGVAMSTATQVADRLEGLGLVQRRPDAADRRVVRLALSAGGQAALAELHGQRDERIAAALDRLSQPEQETVLAGLRLLEHAARESAPEGSRPHPLWDVVSEAMQSEPAGDRAGNHGSSEG
jgi:DNA-binding MarR family transcriptional regulator